MRRNLVFGVQMVSLVAVATLVACCPLISLGGPRVPPHTGIFIDRDGTFVELDRASMSFADSSIDPLPTFQISEQRPLLIVYTPGESPSDLHMYRIERRPVEEIAINITPKGSEVVHVQPQQELVAGSYVIMHGEGSIFENTPCWGFVVGPVETGEVVATPSVPRPTPTPGIGPVLLWQDEFDSLSIADGTVYIADRDYETGHMIVKARDLETGQQLWLKDDWDVRLAAIFAVDHDLVYVVRDDSRIYALDTSSGQEVWKFKTGPDETIMWGSPEIGKTRVVVDGTTIYVPYKHGIGAVDALTGELKWTFTEFIGEEWVGCYQPTAQVVFQGYVLVTCGGEADTVLNPSGQVAWRPPELLGGPKPTYPEVYIYPDVYPLAHNEGMLFVQAYDMLVSFENEGLLAVDFVTGQIIRNYGFNPSGIISISAVAIYGDTLFVGDRAIDMTSAEEKWRWNSETLGSPVWASNGTAYLYSPDLSTLTAVDNASGRILWQNDEIHGGSERAYMAGNEEVAAFCTTVNRPLYGLDPRTGETIWKIKDPPSPTLLTFIRGNLLFATGDGVELLDPMTGETLWSSVAIKGVSKAIQKDSLLLLQNSGKLWVLEIP